MKLVKLSLAAVVAAGVLMVEVSKRIQPSKGAGVHEKVVAPLRVLRPVPKTTAT